MTISQEKFSMTRMVLSVGIGLLLTVGTVWAGPLEDATAAYKRGDYVTALKIIQPLAAQGNVEAQYNLGALYANGAGVPQDYTTSRQWYEKAAAQGLAAAQHNLGLLYQNGNGVPQDYAKARQWWEKASAQGLAAAQNNLGMLYRDGQGVPQNDMRAYMWFNVAAASTGLAQKTAADNRDYVARRMTPAQVAKAQQLSQQCQSQQFRGC
jgi:TPR repeat protein